MEIGGLNQKIVAQCLDGLSDVESFILDRQSHNQELSWLLSGELDSYLPGYFVFNQTGHTPFQRRLGYGLSKVSSWLWARIFLSTVLQPLVRAFFDPLTCGFFKSSLNVQENVSSDEWAKTQSILSDSLWDYWRGNSVVYHQATHLDFYYYFSKVIGPIADLLGVSHDLYQTVKDDQNMFCLTLYELLRDEVLDMENGMKVMAYLSLRSNCFDVFDNRHGSFLDGFGQEINDVIDAPGGIDGEISGLALSHLSSFLSDISGSAKSILIELDNAGEVVMDLLLVELLIRHGHQVCLVARQGPILNDITIDGLNMLLTDSRLAHFDAFLRSGQLRLLGSGSVLPGKYVYAVSDAYRAAYQAADLVVVKGQGNFLSMPMGTVLKHNMRDYSYHKPIYYVMVVKSPSMVDLLRVLFPGQKIWLGMPFLYYSKAYQWGD